MTKQTEQRITGLVLQPVRRNGETFKPDGKRTIELPPAEFVTLLALDVVAELDPEMDNKEAVQEENGTDAGATDGPTMDEIAAVIGELSPDDFTQAGTPEVKALEKALGAEITAGQRDEAWTLYQAQQ